MPKHSQSCKADHTAQQAAMLLEQLQVRDDTGFSQVSSFTRQGWAGICQQGLEQPMWTHLQCGISVPWERLHIPKSGVLLEQSEGLRNEFLSSSRLMGNRDKGNAFLQVLSQRKCLCSKTHLSGRYLSFPFTAFSSVSLPLLLSC